LAFGHSHDSAFWLRKGQQRFSYFATRELALQVAESLDKLGHSIGLKTAVLIGGESMHKQLMWLRRDPHIIISTPGRLIDHLEQKSVKLDKVSILVLDESRQNVRHGLCSSNKRILQTVPKERQTYVVFGYHASGNFGAGYFVYETSDARRGCTVGNRCPAR